MGNSCLFWWGHFLCLFCFDKGGCWDFNHIYRNWPQCLYNKQIGGGWQSIWSWSVISGWWGCEWGSGSSLGLLHHRGIVTIGGEWAFLLLEPSCGFGDFLEFALGQVVYHHRFGLDLAVVVIGFTTDAGVGACVVATTYCCSKHFPISRTLNCLFMGVLVLLFLSAAILGIGVFCGGVVLFWLVLVHG